MLKKIISMLLALTLVFTLGVALVSCTDDSGNNDNAGNNNGGDNTDVKETYVVTVKDSAGNAVSGVEVSMIKVTATTEMPYPGAKKETAEDGKASFEVKQGTWKVSVEDVPAGYVLPEDNFSFTDKAVTITLESLPTYTIKVVDQDGNAVVGANVQMCKKGEAGVCVAFKKPTNDKGESSMQINEASYEAQVTSVPEGYAKPDGYFDFEGSAVTGYTVTITVTKN